jgi:hypothetical protein
LASFGHFDVHFFNLKYYKCSKEENMKNSWILASALSMGLAGLGLAQHQPAINADRLYDLTQISQEEVQQFLEHPSPSSILRCPEGSSLPLTFFLKGDLLELTSSGSVMYRLTIKQTFYLRLQEEQVFISMDGLNWKSWEEQLTGMIGVSLTHVQKEEPQLQLGAEVYLR